MATSLPRTLLLTWVIFAVKWSSSLKIILGKYDLLPGEVCLLSFLCSLLIYLLTLFVESYQSHCFGLDLGIGLSSLYCRHILEILLQKMAYVNEGSVIATGVIFITLGILAVALRFNVRRDEKLALGPDDWLILLGLVCQSQKLCIWIRAVTNTENLIFQIFMVASAITTIVGMLPGPHTHC